jgi:hypothetical protein
LKLKCEEPLSKFAFKLNLRRYMAVPWWFRQGLEPDRDPPPPRGSVSPDRDGAARAASALAELGTPRFASFKKVGRCRLPVSKPMSKAPMVSALETRIS